MSDFDWDRKGPPRPASSSMDHPQGLERPWVTPKEREAKAAASRQAEAERKARFRLLKEAVRLEPFGLELEQRQQSG